MTLNGGPAASFPVPCHGVVFTKKREKNANMRAGFSGGVRENWSMVEICYSACTATNVADECNLGSASRCFVHSLFRLFPVASPPGKAGEHAE